MYVETPGHVLDAQTVTLGQITGQPIAVSISTPWIKTDTMEGYQRVWELAPQLKVGAASSINLAEQFMLRGSEWHQRDDYPALSNPPYGQFAAAAYGVSSGVTLTLDGTAVPETTSVSTHFGLYTVFSGLPVGAVLTPHFYIAAARTAEYDIDGYGYFTMLWSKDETAHPVATSLRTSISAANMIDYSILTSGVEATLGLLTAYSTITVPADGKIGFGIYCLGESAARQLSQGYASYMQLDYMYFTDADGNIYTQGSSLGLWSLFVDYEDTAVETKTLYQAPYGTVGTTQTSLERIKPARQKCSAFRLQLDYTDAAVIELVNLGVVIGRKYGKLGRTR
jgi:hypothetical protein